MFNLTSVEIKILKKLNSPIKIQNFLDTMPINWEKRGETNMSARRVLRAGKMHCFEGALLAAAALWIHGEEPLLMDLKAKDDYDHVVTLYKRNGYWGAISKTNHATLRWRDPVYKTLRELALSYFHEYFLDDTGKKCLQSFSRPFNLKRLGASWITAEEDLHYIVKMLDRSPHTKIVPQKNKGYIRLADKMERRAGRIIEWSKKHPKT